MTLRLMPPHTDMIQVLADELLAIPRHDLRQTLVLLPTQRLGTQLLATMSMKEVAFVPPQVLTMESFLGREASRIKPLPPVIPDAAWEWVLADIIRGGSYEHVRQGHERELRLFHQELTEAGLADIGFAKLRETLAVDVYRSDEHQGSLFARIDEMEAILSAAQDKLCQWGVQTKGESLATAAKILAEALSQQTWQPPWKHIYWVGFTSTVESWTPFLRSLQSLPQVHSWLSQSPPLYASQNPLRKFAERVFALSDQDMHPKSTLDSRVFVAESPSPAHEVIQALSLARHLIRSGVSPSHIGILVTNEGDYAPLLRTYGPLFQVPMNLAITFPLFHTEAGAWLKALTTYLRQPKSIHLLPFLIHPLTFQLVRGESDVSSAQWASAFTHAFQRQPHRPDFLQLQEHLPPALRPLAATLEGLLTRVAIQGTSPQPLAAWLAPWQTMVDHLKLFAVDGEHSDIAQASEEVWRQFESLLTQWSPHLSNAVSGGEFLALLERHVLAADLRTVGEPLAGVQVLSLAESRMMPFAYVMILGCNEGIFPKSLPQDELLDDFLKRQIGLPGWGMLEAMEDLTFHFLQWRIPHLILHYSREDLNGLRVKSRFVENVLAQGAIPWPAFQFDPEVFSRSYTRLKFPPGPRRRPEGMIGTPQKLRRLPMSASSLGDLLKCPYRYLLHSLQVREMTLPSIKPDLRQEGDWLHDVLEAFFTGHVGGHRILPHDPGASTTMEFSDYALQRLMTLTRLLAPAGSEQTVLFHQLQHYSWPRFATHLAALYDRDVWCAFERGHREFRLASHQQKGHPAQITVNGVTRPVRGSIDSIDPGAFGPVITDYKRKNVPNTASVNRGDSPQLIFYSLALAGLEKSPLDLSQLIVGYWSILDAQWTPIATGSHAPTTLPHALGGNRKVSLEEFAAKLHHLWEWRETHVDATGRFYADPSNAGKVCDTCAYQRLCHKDDPALADRMEAQRHLARHRQGGPI